MGYTWPALRNPMLIPIQISTGQIAIVHNGIIENYRTLKTWLIAQGHKFKSETDSEVIAHLIEEMDGKI